MDKTHAFSDIPFYYIDYERMGRDMEMSGDIFTVETGYKQVHIF
ncbi:antirestriction protein ArdA [Gammaproteobacteria bacterium AH-315-C21]|nr:antirestriction protein ArdA [Gammaproteobacteria bacterium AH-315-C21]